MQCLTKNRIYGFITDVDTNAKNADKKAIYVISALIDGKEVTLDTVALADGVVNNIDAQGNYGATDLYKFTLNDDNEIVKVGWADCFAVNDIEDEFGNHDVAFMTKDDITGGKYVFDRDDLLYIAEKSGSLLDVRKIDANDDEKDFQSVDGAVFYQLKLDDNNNLTLEAAALRDVKKGYVAGLFQTDEDAAAWNIVVFVNPADFEE